MDVLVTGGSGFIGQRLLAALDADPAIGRVVNLDLVPSAVALSVESHVVDIRRPIDAVLLGPERFDVCVHLAALAKEPGYERNEYFATNETGTKHVLDLCGSQGIDRVVFASTMMVHGPTEDRLTEHAPLDGDTFYGLSKIRAEQLVADFAAEDSKRSAAILRPAVVFGPGDDGNFERLRRFLDRRMFFYVGRTTTVKSCIHVDDVVGFIQHLIANESVDTWNLAIPEPTTIGEIVPAIQAAFGSESWVPTLPYRLAHTASRPFEWLATAGIETGIHRRRIEKLYESTNIDAAKFAASSYKLGYPTLTEAVNAWAHESR